MEWDFTVIPYVLLVLKFVELSIWANGQVAHFNWFLSVVYVGTAIYVWVFAPVLHRLLYKMVHKA
jgi:hypothetical protein